MLLSSVARLEIDDAPDLEVCAQYNRQSNFAEVPNGFFRSCIVYTTAARSCVIAESKRKRSGSSWRW